MYTYKCKVVRVIDGDTVVLDIDLGLFVTIRRSARLLGYDAPEKFGVKKGTEEFEKGVQATIKLTELLGDYANEDFICKTHLDRNDKYGRVLVELFDDFDDLRSETSINEQMIQFIDYELGKKK